MNSRDSLVRGNPNADCPSFHLEEVDDLHMVGRPICREGYNCCEGCNPQRPQIYKI
jgi:hypothetical protein